MARRGSRLTPTRKAVVLAAGRGTRMRRADPDASATAAQLAAAASGAKGMIPMARPFLEYAISALADAGVTDVCLVIGPDHHEVRDHFEHRVPVTRVQIRFAIQPTPLGTADAVLMAESFADGEHVLVVNSDNYYPVHTLSALRELGSAGVAAFERDALVRAGNIDAARVRQFAILEADEHGMLRRVIEKPDPANVAALADAAYVGMNSWSLPPEIYDDCRRIAPSVRGELELPLAVQHAVDRGVGFRVLKFHEGVLDLSCRGDIAAVADRLRDVVPRL